MIGRIQTIFLIISFQRVLDSSRLRLSGGWGDERKGEERIIRTALEFMEGIRLSCHFLEGFFLFWPNKTALNTISKYVC